MKWTPSYEGVFPGEVILTPVCSKCGYDKLYTQKAGCMLRASECPACNNKIVWKSYLDTDVGKKGGVG